MTTNELHALTGAYAVDALDDLERLRFERHLAECADCAHEVGSLQEAAALLSSPVETEPPATLRHAVLDGIRTVRPLPPVATPVEAVRRRARLFPRLVAASVAAVALLIGGGVALHQSQSGTEPVAQQVAEASDARTQSLSFPDGSRATLTHSASVDRAVLTTQKMAAPPSGKAYELWYRRGSQMIPAGLMTAGGDQTVVLHGRVDGADWVGITVEPAAGSKQPTGKAVAAFDLKRAV